jgi:acyl dehydratase
VGPQPFHIDRIAAPESMFGGLIPSGFHTRLVSYLLYYEHGLMRQTAFAGLCFDEIRFLKPMRPGDTVGVIVTVVEKRLASKPGCGVVRLKLETENQDGEVILSMCSQSARCLPADTESDQGSRPALMRRQ